jgi:hypothetical protein
MRARTGVRWRPLQAGVVVTPGATGTTAHLDAPDLMGAVAGWGRASGCGRRCCPGAGGWACGTDGPHDTSTSVEEIRGYTNADITGARLPGYMATSLL